MSRIAAVLNPAVVALLALSIGIAPDPAVADVDRAFTTFEAPDTTQLLDPCKTEAVLARMRELDAAAERLRIKIQRIDKAMQETLDAMPAARDAARLRMLVDDYNQLVRLRGEWEKYRAYLEAQIVYYNQLPACGGRGKRIKTGWPVEVRQPVLVGPPVPVDSSKACVTPEGSARIKEVEAGARGLADDIANQRKALEADVKALADLNAKGRGDSEEAKRLKAEIKRKLASIAYSENALRDVYRQVEDLIRRYACKPADSQHGAVRLGTCEAGVLAQVNAARADPPAYAATLRGARGRFAAEARDFLAGREPAAALAADARLTAAARGHAADLAARDVVGHRGGDGRGLLDRLRAQGMWVTMSAEVIAVRQDTPAGAVRALVIDEGHPGGPHRKDLFNAHFTLAGIACVRTRSHGQLVVIDLSNAPMRRDGAEPG